MSHHTQGLIKADGSETSLATWLEAADGKRICTMTRGETDWGDAQRLAACWNAYKGLSTEFLEQINLANVLIGANVYTDALEAERNELQEALSKINDAACYASEENTEAAKEALLLIGNLARAAIAKAEGQS